jgi:YesN/AraC family two-component response regulator
MQYINQCRVQKAVEILRHSRSSVDDISRHLGYHRTSYFCKVFKQITGETPHAYRKKYEIR